MFVHQLLIATRKVHRVLRSAPTQSIAGFIAALFVALAPPQALSESAQMNQTSDDAGPKLEEITVTATRRSESVQKVPISINALSQSDLSDTGAKNIADIAALTPGLQFDVPNGYASTITTVSIRGMNTQVGASVVGIYLDDTPIQTRLPATGNVGPPLPYVFDMNRVEVARGPQGTLFGAGSEAGAVRFITNEPSLTTFSGFSHAETSYTQDGSPSYEIGAAAGGPIVEDKLGFRVSAWDRHDGGYIDRIDPITGSITARNANRGEKQAFKAAFAFQANDDIKITPSVLYQYTHAADSGRFYGNVFSDTSTGHFVNGTLLPEESTDHFVLPSLKVQAHLPFAELTFTTSYIDRKVDLHGDASVFYGGFFSSTGGFGSSLGVSFPTSPSDVTPLIIHNSLRGITEEVRLASNNPDAAFTWVAGIFNDHRTQLDSQDSYTAAFGDPAYDSYYVREVTTDDQTAAFAQGDFHFSSQWTATLGMRVAQVRTHERDDNGAGLFNAGEAPVAFTSIKETPYTPRVALSYQADGNNLFYAAIGKGFRIGGGNAPLPDYCGITAGAYKSDYVWSYELGAKNTLLNGRVQIDSSIFHINWSKIQQIVIPPCGAAEAANTGPAVINGFDFALQALVTDKLKVNFDVGYVDAYFTQDVFAGPGIPLVQKDDKIGFLPQVNAPWNVNLSANYEIPLPNSDKIHLRGGFLYNSRNPGPFITQIPTSPNYYPLIVADPPTRIFNVRAGYTRGKFDLTLYVDNVFNSHPLLGAFQYPSSSNIVTNTTFRPRTVGLAANLEF